MYSKRAHYTHLAPTSDVEDRHSELAYKKELPPGSRYGIIHLRSIVIVSDRLQKTERPASQETDGPFRFQVQKTTD